MDDLFAAKRKELNEERDNLLREMEQLQGKLEGIELELGAIAAYDDFKTKAKHKTTVDTQGTATQPVATRTITRDAVVRVVQGAGSGGIGRAGIMNALGVKGDKTGEAAVDNRLRDLKATKRVTHKGRVYTAPA